MNDAPSFTDLSPEEAEALLEDPPPNFVLLDVRTPREWAVRRLEGAVLIPIQEIEKRAHELDPEAEILVYCAHGHRSVLAASWLASRGFAKVRNLRGGLARWTGPMERGGT